MNGEIHYHGKDLETMASARNYHRWIFETFTPFLGERVAEVGAGMGTYTKLLLDAGVKRLIAFEPSNNMFSILEKTFQENSSVDTVNTTFECVAATYKNRFDAVLFINVLEHIKDAKATLSHAIETLRHQGHVLIFVPALSCLYSDFDEKVGHFRRYSKEELMENVNAAGFCIKMLKYFDMAGILPWYLRFVVLKKTTIAANALSHFDRLVVPFMKRMEYVIPPIIGKNLICIGQKT